MQEIIMMRCLYCKKVKKHSGWIEINEYQKRLILHLYKVLWRDIFCPTCRDDFIKGGDFDGK